MNNIAKKAYKMSSENSDGVERNERSIEAIKRQISTFHTHSNKTILDQTTASFLVSEKQKLLGIEEGANKNIQPDWNESDSSKDSFITNKPIIPIVDSSLSSQSTNAIQNKAVKSAIDNEASSRVAADENLQNQINNQKYGYGELSDINTVITENKTYYYVNTTLNQPNGEATWGTVVYSCGINGASWFTQLVFPNEADYFYRREYVNGAWKPWKQICTNGANVEQILSSQISRNTDIELNGSIKNYRYIIIGACDQSNGGKSHIMLPTKLFTESVDSAIQNSWNRLVVTTSEGWMSLWYVGERSNGHTLLHIDGFSSSPNFNWLLVYGVK